MPGLSPSCLEQLIASYGIRLTWFSGIGMQTFAFPLPLLSVTHTQNKQIVNILDLGSSLWKVSINFFLYSLN